MCSSLMVSVFRDLVELTVVVATETCWKLGRMEFLREPLLHALVTAVQYMYSPRGYGLLLR